MEPNEAVEQVEQSAVESAAPIVENAEGSSAEVVSEAYNPDLSYVVHDKKLEFDEFLKPIIKDKEIEKKVRDLYTKSAGLDFYKEKFTNTSKQLEEYAPIREKAEYYDQVVEKLNNYRQSGDYRKFFEELGLTDKEILQYAYERVNYQELPPDQRQLIDTKYSLEQQSQMQAAQIQQYEQQIFNQSVQARTYELNSELEKAEVRDFASRFDSMVGKPGAFREEVIRRGQTKWHVNGVDARPAELAQEIMGTFASLRNIEPQTFAAPTATQVQANSKPTIPNIQGSNSSPVKKQFTSIADIKKARDEARQQTL